MTSTTTTATRRRGTPAAGRTMRVLSQLPALLLLLVCADSALLRGGQRGRALEDPAGGEGGNPYDVYFKKDWNAATKTGRPMPGGNRLFRARKDVRGYTPESRYWYNRWRNGPPNTRGKTWVHSCASFPFCNHIPPPPSSLPAPWDIPAPVPNPTFPSLHPFPKKLFGDDNFYGRDMYTYQMGFPFYKKTDKFWK